MARQLGIMPIGGAIDTIQFRETQDGYRAGKKSNMTKAKMANNPAFDRTRRANLDFTRAAKASILINNAIGSLAYKTADTRAFSRLQGVIRKAMSFDTTHSLGSRTLVDGKISELFGFEFNVDSSLSNKIRVPINASIDRLTGVLTVNFPAYSPQEMIRKPYAATHFKISVAAVEVDFDTNKYVVDIKDGGLQVWDNVPRDLSSIVCHVPAASMRPLFLFIAIRYYVMEEGNPELLHNVGALQLVEMDKV